MKKLLVATFSALLLFAVQGSAQNAQPAKVEFTQKDRIFAIKYMDETKQDYLGQLQGLSDAQLNFKSAPDRWSIAEIAEHITMVEQMLFDMVLNGQMKAQASKCESPMRISDGMVIGAVTNRSRRATAPEPVVPKGKWKTVPELTASFEKVRNATIEYMKNEKSDLRGVFGPSPFGMVDGFQQILFVVGHSERHLAQLKEVKAHANYPKK